MNAAEIITAIQAAEALLPEIEKGFSTVRVIVADIEGKIADLKAKVSNAKGVATK